MKEIRETKFGIRRGTAVLVVLHSPREKTWGILDEISAAGVFLRGLDLNSFDDWVQAVVHEEPFVGFGDLFFPMWRVERISRDESFGRCSFALVNRLSDAPVVHRRANWVAKLGSPG